MGSDSVTGFCHASQHTSTERDVVSRLCSAFAESPLPLAYQLQFFPRHVRRQDIARLMVRYELFRKVLEVNGSVVECGVMAGGSLFSWLHFSAILEPYNHTRRIVGFDSFSGFPGVAEEDRAGEITEHHRAGALRTHQGIRQELMDLAAIHDANRPLGHIPKVELVEGDACETIPEYVRQNPHLVISLLHLDFDLYAPTRVALETLLPRVVRGGLVVFDELNCPQFPGETAALVETLGLSRVELRRLPMDPYISYFVQS